MREIYVLKATLVVNDVEVALGAETLASIAAALPDRPDNRRLFEEIATSPCARTRAMVADKEQLTDAALLRLANDNTHEVVLQLIQNGSTRSRMPASRIEELLEIGDSEILKSIIGNLDNMPQINAARIRERLAQHPDPGVRLELARLPETGLAVLEKLALNDPDSDVLAIAQETLERLICEDARLIVEDDDC